jgi:hypothetical protein
MLSAPPVVYAGLLLVAVSLFFTPEFLDVSEKLSTRSAGNADQASTTFV